MIIIRVAFARVAGEGSQKQTGTRADSRAFDGPAPAVVADHTADDAADQSARERFRTKQLGLGENEICGKQHQTDDLLHNLRRYSVTPTNQLLKWLIGRHATHPIHRRAGAVKQCGATNAEPCTLNVDVQGAH